MLLADDHPTNRKVVEMILAGAGVQITAVENGVEAVAAFRMGGFDLVLMDMQMPLMDGLEATRQLRAEEVQAGAPRTPVIMLTANALREHVAESLSAGADAHLAKPIRPAALLAAVDEAIRSAEPARPQRRARRP